jgi:two-component system copper resistance phosphate regulon response regulator CusR
MRLLIVEDEQKVAANLKRALEESGFSADIAEDGDAGLQLALATSYDLVILDVMLPGMDGFALIQELRSARPDCRVLFLTARDSVRDRVRGLELGGDDYIVKPFALSELLARVRTILRRGPAREPTTWKLADLELDLTRQRASRSGRVLDLTPKEFMLLSLMLRRRGEVLSRSVIAEEIWDVAFQFDSNVVDVHLRRLRSKVDDPFPSKLIHTVRGVGYVLEERPGEVRL